MDRIHITDATYIIILLSFLSGYFNYIFILLLLIIIHELGHMITATLLKIEIDKIIVYPFGGLTKYNNLLNTSMLKELLVLLGGPLFQILFYILSLMLYKNNLISDNNYHVIYTLHKTLLYFNFLPIIPLDGSKLFNLVLEKFFSYKLSNIILIFTSFITILILIIFEKRLIIIFLSVLLIKTIINEINNHNLKFNKFILERYLYDFNFKEGKTIKNIKQVKKSRKHTFICKNQIITEKEYLKRYFDRIHYF